MWKSTVDRIKAEICTSKIKMSWSVITGSLESIVSLPDNYEWLGKNEINIGFQNKWNEKTNCEITDLDFSEYYDEKSSGILQTLSFGQNRFRILYYAIQETPVIFIKYEILTNVFYPTDTQFIPFYFNLNKTIDKVDLNKINHEISCIKADKENLLVFYMENGIDIDITQNNTKGWQTVLIKMLNNESFITPKSIIKLPKMYIGSLKNFSNNDLQTWHYKNIDALKKYEKWVYERNR